MQCGAMEWKEDEEITAWALAEMEEGGVAVRMTQLGQIQSASWQKREERTMLVIVWRDRKRW